MGMLDPYDRSLGVSLSSMMFSGENTGQIPYDGTGPQTFRISWEPGKNTVLFQIGNLELTGTPEEKPLGYPTDIVAGVGAEAADHPLRLFNLQLNDQPIGVNCEIEEGGIPFSFIHVTGADMSEGFIVTGSFLAEWNPESHIGFHGAFIVGFSYVETEEPPTTATENTSWGDVKKMWR